MTPAGRVGAGESHSVEERMEGLLKDKVVVVTGGLGALGDAVARACRARGAQTALIDRMQPAAGQEPAASKPSLVLGNVNLASYDEACSAMKAIARETGGIDALVNVAGGFRWETLEGGDLASWDALFEVNLRTAATASKAVLPYLLERGRGRIVNLGAAAAAKAAAGMGAYAASKAGVMRLTEALADEVKDRDITVNAVLPSIIDTARNRADMPDADFSRWVPPAAIANLVCFLLSDEADAITGALIPITGKT